MPIDYLSTLNKNGSGLNLTELAGSIAQAETAPRLYAAEKRKTEAELSISAYGQIRSAFETFDTALEYLQGTSVLSASSSDNAVSVTVTDRSAVQSATNYIDVIQTAKRQVLEFTGFTSPDDVIGTGDLTIEFGVWVDDTNFAVNPAYEGSTITIGEGATLDELAQALSSLDGVTAKVLDRGDGTYTLGIVSEEGAGRAMRITTGGTLTGNMVDFDTTTTNATKQVQAASDAMLTVDGVTVFRSTNTIDDVIDGLTLTLNGPTDYAATVAVSRDADVAQNVLEAFIAQVNTALTELKSLTAFTTADTEGGALAGDRIATAIRDNLKSVLNAPMIGHKDKPVHLADLGIATARDGSLYLNTALFERSFANDPTAFDAVFQDTFRSDNPDLKVSGTANASTKSGTYDFTFDPDAGTLSLAGRSMFATALDNDKMRFVSISGDMAGTVITGSTDAATAKVSFGRSLVSSLRQALNDALKTGGTLDGRDTYFTNLMATEDTTISELETKQSDLETFYMKKFAAMEQIISELNSTGDYLTNLVDSWNNSN